MFSTRRGLISEGQTISSNTERACPISNTLAGRITFIGRLPQEDHVVS